MHACTARGRGSFIHSAALGYPPACTLLELLFPALTHFHSLVGHGTPAGLRLGCGSRPLNRPPEPPKVLLQPPPLSEHSSSTASAVLSAVLQAEVLVSPRAQPTPHADSLAHRNIAWQMDILGNQAGVGCDLDRCCPPSFFFPSAWQASDFR